MKNIPVVHLCNVGSDKRLGNKDYSLSVDVYFFLDSLPQFFVLCAEGKPMEQKKEYSKENKRLKEQAGRGKR